MKKEVSFHKNVRTVFFLGVTMLCKNDFEEWQQKGVKIKLLGYGTLILEDGYDQLIADTVASIHVVGKVHCSERVRKIYLPTF